MNRGGIHAAEKGFPWLAVAFMPTLLMPPILILPPKTIFPPTIRIHALQGLELFSVMTKISHQNAFFSGRQSQEFSR